VLVFKIIAWPTIWHHMLYYSAMHNLRSDMSHLTPSTYDIFVLLNLFYLFFTVPFSACIKSCIIQTHETFAWFNVRSVHWTLHWLVEIFVLSGSHCTKLHNDNLIWTLWAVLPSADILFQFSLPSSYTSFPYLWSPYSWPTNNSGILPSTWTFSSWTRKQTTDWMSKSKISWLKIYSQSVHLGAKPLEDDDQRFFLTEPLWS
jgi:hypothetical protein